MKKHSLDFEPTKELLYSKIINTRLVWRCTKENNFYAVWRSCTDEDSPWEHELLLISSHKNEALEQAVILANRDFLEEKAFKKI